MSCRRGIFITIEGVEGAGKSTLASAIGKELQAAGFEVIITAEPGGDVVAKRIRELLLNSSDHITDRAELLLFEAARAQHVETIILPNLKKGAVVISDRYADSSIAYQGFARGIDIESVSMLNDFATNGLKPDLTILLDLPADAGLARQCKLDRVSSEGIAFHEAVRQGFLEQAKSEPERFVIIDATQPFQSVLEQSLEAIRHITRKD